MLKPLTKNIMVMVDDQGEPVSVYVGKDSTLDLLTRALVRRYPGYRIERNLGAWSRNGDWLVIPVVPPRR